MHRSYRLLASLTILLGSGVMPVRAELSDYEGRHYNVRMNTLSAGYGGVLLRDDYLSPLSYGGYSISMLSEWAQYRYRPAGKPVGILGRMLGMRARTTDTRWLSLRHLAVDYSSALNPAGNASITRLQGRWEDARLYRLLDTDYGRLDLGGGYTLGVGGLYSSRNGNNPATLKLDLNLSLALHYSYRLPWRTLPALLRIATRTDLVGTQFSQQYGESYYELYYVTGQEFQRFSLVHLGNQWGQQVRVSLDLPVLDLCTLSLQYRYQGRSWTVHGLYNSQTDHTLALGLVRYLQPRGGRGYINRENLALPF